MAISNSGYIQRDLLIMNVWSVSLSATGSSLFQAMACRQLGDKQLPRSTPSFQLVWIFSSSGSICFYKFFILCFIWPCEHIYPSDQTTPLCAQCTRPEIDQSLHSPQTFYLTLLCKVTSGFPSQGANTVDIVSIVWLHNVLLKAC